MLLTVCFSMIGLVSAASGVNVWRMGVREKQGAPAGDADFAMLLFFWLPALAQMFGGLVVAITIWFIPQTAYLQIGGTLLLITLLPYLVLWLLKRMD